MTDPGPFTAAPQGGMVEAQNVVVLRPGVMEPRPGSQWFKDSTLKTGDYEASAIYADPNANSYVWASAAGWLIRRNGTTTITGPTSFVPGKIRTCPTGGRALFTSENGVCTLPDQLASPARGSSTVAYRAGMPQPYAPAAAAGVNPTGFPGTASWLPNGDSVAYRTTLRRKLANGAVIESAPSARVVVTNSAGAARGVYISDVLNTNVYYAWRAGGAAGAGFGELMAGDELCIYRSPRVTGTPSDEMRLRAVLTYNTTFNGFCALDSTGAAAQWFDGLDDSAWNGEALYTNATQEGAALANYRPQYARDIALYNGITFYAGAKTAQRVNLVLTKIGTTATVADGSQAMCSFAFTGDITAGTNTILNCTNISYFSVGQVITTVLQTPGTASASFPANTQVTAVNTATNVVTLSANAGATGVGVNIIAWDWIESSIAGTRIFHYAGVGLLTTARYFTGSFENLENRWNGDLVTTLQLRCNGTTQTTEILCTWEQPDCTSAAFSIRSTKPLAWNRYVDSVTGVTSAQDGGVAELQWSKTNEPEHCPLPYRTVIGDAAYAIRRIESARQSLLVLKDDGLYQVFGTDPANLQIELVDRTIVIPAPKDAGGDEPSKWVGRFDDRVFAITTRGPMAITDTGAVPVGAPILESLRRRFQFAYGANDESVRALMVDTQSRRVGFFYDATGNGDQSVGYVLDVETGAWTYWTLPRVVADFSVYTAFGAPIFAGGYSYALLLESRTMLDDTTITVSTLPDSCDRWPSEAVTIVDVDIVDEGTEVTITAGSEWTPAVGDLLVRSGVAYLVTYVDSATVFGVDDPGATLTTGAATWREGYECRCVWTARDERNIGAEKHWGLVSFAFELSTLFSRYVSPTESTGLLKSYFRGYRNPSTAIEQYVDGSQTIGLAPWPNEPAWKPVSVPSSIARDWALRVGFSIRQACAWFASSGVSVAQVQQAAPGKGAR